MSKPEKKPDVLYVDVIQAAGLSAEAIYSIPAKFEEINSFPDVTLHELQTAVERTYSEIATLYVLFKRLGFSPAQCTIRSRRALIQMAENELNLKPLNLESLMPKSENNEQAVS